MRRKLSSGNLASMVTRLPARRMTASTCVPSRNRCLTAQLPAGSTWRSRSSSRYSPRLPRSFGRLQHVLQRGDVPADLLDAARRLSEGTELLVDVRDRPVGAGELRGEGVLRPGEVAGERLERLVLGFHLPGPQVRELLLQIEELLRGRAPAEDAHEDDEQQHGDRGEDGERDGIHAAWCRPGGPACVNAAPRARLPGDACAGYGRRTMRRSVPAARFRRALPRALAREPRGCPVRRAALPGAS